MQQIDKRIHRIRAWMDGYYASQVDSNKALSDIPLSELSREYLDELATRANKATSHYKSNPKNKLEQ